MQPRLSLLLAVLITTAPAFVAGAPAGGPSEPTGPVDWGRPETIDPRGSAVLDFLDTDLMAYRASAEQAHRAGHYEEAARLYLFVLRHRTNDPVMLYNLACAYGRMGDGKKAAAALRHALDAGFSDYALLWTDEDFKRVYGDFFFTQIFNEARSRETLGGEKILVPARMLVPARLHLPRGHDAKKASTLLIGLHGYGATCEGFAAIWGLFEDPRFIFVSPESPYPRPLGVEGGQSGYTWGLPTRDKTVMTVADPLVGENMKATAQEVARSHKVGDVYLLGHSQGGAFAAMAAIKSPDDFRGVIVLAGVFPEDLVTDRELAAAAGKVRFFISHGRRDQAVNLSEGIKFRDRLVKAGFDVTFVPHDGDHGVQRDVLRQAAGWIEAAPPWGRPAVPPRGGASHGGSSREGPR